MLLTVGQKTRLREYSVGGKGCFMLHSEIIMKSAKVCKIIGTCAILHNIALSLREEMEDDDDDQNAILL